MPARLFDGASARGREVTVALEAGSLTIRDHAAGATWVWPVRSLRWRDSPDPAQAVISMRRNDPARLVIDDPALRDALAHHIRRGRRGLVRMRAGWLAAIAIGMVFAAWMLIARLPELVAPLVPRAMQAEFGLLVEKSILASHRVCTGAPGQAAISALEARLAHAAGIANPVAIVVVDDPVANAFALPGDRIVVLRGLIDTVTDGDELAGVLAHETGHLAHRDPVTAMIRGLGLGAVAHALGMGGAVSTNLGEEMIGLAYSRRVEARADRAGVTYLRQAGLRADGLARFFARLEAKQGSGGLPPFLADHPPLAEREAATAADATGAAPFGPRRWQAIRAMCGR